MLGATKHGAKALLRFCYAWLGLLLALVALVPLLPLIDPTRQDLGQEYVFSAAGHWLGTGENGIDLASNLAWGMRLSVGLAFASVLLSSLLGLLWGGFAASRGGLIERLFLVVVDVADAFPGLLLVIALASVLGPRPENVVIALVMGSWVGYARLARAQVLSLREEPYVEAVRALGIPSWRRFLRHVAPQMLPSFFVKMTYGLSSAILAEASLGFLGLGSPPGTPSWGQLLMQSRDVLTSAPHALLVPGVSLTLTVFAVNVVGDDLRDKLEGIR